MGWYSTAIEECGSCAVVTIVICKCSGVTGMCFGCVVRDQCGRVMSGFQEILGKLREAYLNM